ncbi:MAG: coniferyl-alcohol dehydrogenase [Actinomycetota bacterium]|jgi:NAD(P)-dependent dehydrogenase (short-subunit alcohol dehydrogenase family)
MSEDPTVALDRNYSSPARQSDAADPPPPAPVVVTGAASGIGAATVARLIAAGRPVIGLDRQPARGCPTVLCDLARPETIDAAVGELPGEIGGLANVAGVPGTFPAELVMRVNVLGLRHLTEALLPRLVSGSAVVNVASVAAVRNPAPRELVAELLATPSFDAGVAWCLEHPLDAPSAYRFSKQVLIEWTLQASAAWRRRGVRVVSVSPGVVDTPILPDFRASMGDDAIDAATAEAGRLAEPHDIAPVIAFLLSPDARWVNGVDLRVDGGLVGGRLALPVDTGVGSVPS